MKDFLAATWWIWLLAGGFVTLCVWDVQRWARYREEHHCVEIDRTPETTYYWQYDSKGSPLYMYPVTVDRVTYRCDGGEIVNR